MRLLHRASREGDRFLNPVPTAIGGWRLAAKVLPRYLANREERFPREIYDFRTDPAAFLSEPETGLRITWFGHSGALIEIDGLRVLLDPVWDERASPYEWVGPKRFFAPTLALADLPALDVVLITHDHYDHLGGSTVRELSRLPNTQQAQWITSLNVAPILQSFGVSRERVTEMDWTDTLALQSVSSGATAALTAYPSRHFSGRSLRTRFKTLWSSFVLAGSRHTIYLGADSGWWPGFREIAARHLPLTLSMLEIGAFHELWADIHLGPDGAARAYDDMGRPGLLMPIHWGLFDLALHAWRQPIQRLSTIADERGLKLWSPTPGVPTDLHRDTEVRSDWWHPAASGV